MVCLFDVTNLYDPLYNFNQNQDGLTLKDSWNDSQNGGSTGLHHTYTLTKTKLHIVTSQCMC